MGDAILEFATKEWTFHSVQRGKRFWFAVPVERQGEQVSVAAFYVLAPPARTRPIVYPEGTVGNHTSTVQMRLDKMGIAELETVSGVQGELQAALRDSLGAWGFNPRYRDLPVPPVTVIFDGSATPPIPESRDPQPLRRAVPRYPSSAARKGIDGFAVVEFCVGDDGQPIDVRVLDSQPDEVFDAAATKAIRRWEYEAPASTAKPVCPKPVVLTFHR